MENCMPTIKEYKAMKKYLVCCSFSFEIEANSEDEASDLSNDKLMEEFPDANIDYIEELK